MEKELIKVKKNKKNILNELVSDNSSILIFREYRNYTKNDCMVARLSDFNMLEKYPVMEKREIRDFLMTENKNIFFNREEKKQSFKKIYKGFLSTICWPKFEKR